MEVFKFLSFSWTIFERANKQNHNFTEGLSIAQFYYGMFVLRDLVPQSHILAMH